MIARESIQTRRRQLTALRWTRGCAEASKRTNRGPSGYALDLPAGMRANTCSRRRAIELAIATERGASAQRSDVMLIAREAGSGGAAVEAEMSEPARGLPSAKLTFPRAGCWELEVVGDAPLVTTVVFVFPAECTPSTVDGSVPDDCLPPEA